MTAEIVSILIQVMVVSLYLCMTLLYCNVFTVICNSKFKFYVSSLYFLLWLEDVESGYTANW